MSPPKILILEDISFDLELIQASLAEGGVKAETICVDNQKDFLAALNNHQIDLVLADYSLPNFNGLNALEAVKTIRPDIAFILVSGILGEEPAIETLKQGATDYVLKQRLSRLAPAVKRALRERQEKQTREHMEAALEASQTRFRASVETILDCFSIYSAVRCHTGKIQDFCIAYLNAAACEQVGGNQEDLQGQSLCQLLPMHLETGLFEAYCRVVESGEPFMGEVSIYTPNSEQVQTVLDVRAAKLEDGVVVTWRDITQRKQGEKEREELLAAAQSAKAEAEAASRIKDEFLATLSHELRTPLNAMQGWVQLLQRRNLNESLAARAFETIQRNLDALKQLIEDVLDVSRIIRGKLRLNVATTDMKAVVMAAIDTISPAIKAKRIQLTTEIEQTGPILGDRNRLQQAIWNLLSNAVKYTPEAGNITVRLDRLERFVRLQVEDSGIGIAPEFLPYIFERFRQADSSTTRNHNGLGLGLAIVRHLIELHGGVVQAESPGLGQGATFTVMLPQLPGELHQNLSSPEAQQLLQENRGDLPRLDGVRILIMDNDADTRELLTTVLAELGADVSAIRATDQAMELEISFQPTVLICDTHSLGRGQQLLTKLHGLQPQPSRSDGNRPGAIALSAYTTPEERQRSSAAGFNVTMTKPVEIRQLVLAVAQLGNGDGRAN